MSRTIMLIPIGSGVGVTSVSLGMIRAMERQGVTVNFFKPIAQPRSGDTGPERSTATVRNASTITPPEPFEMKYAESLISSGKTSDLLEAILQRFREETAESDVVIVEGLIPTDKHQFANDINYRVAKALGAEMVFVTHPGEDTPEQLQERIEIAVSSFGGKSNENIAGCVINKIGAPIATSGLTELFDIPEATADQDVKAFSKSSLPILGCIPWSADLIAPRVKDLATHLEAKILNEGELNNRRLQSVTFCARSIPNMVEHFKAGSMLVTSGDRSDVIVAVCLAAMNGMKIGCLLLTGDYKPEAEVIALCAQAMESGLPVLLVETNTWQTAQRLQNFNAGNSS